MECASFNPKNKDKFPFLSKHGFTIYECKNCGHRFSEISNCDDHINSVYSDSYFFKGQQGYPNYLDQKEILLKYGRNYSRILSKYINPGKIFDVGSAAGFILKGFEENGWHCTGIEPNHRMAEFGREALNLDIKTGDLESYHTNETYNVVSLIQVIGHLHNLDTAVDKIKHLLNAGGLVIIESWDMDSIYAKLMGRHWHEYSPPSVINWFSDKTLSALFANRGFTLLAKGRPSKKISIRHGISLLKSTTPNFLSKDNVLGFFEKRLGHFTIPYPPFDLKWYIFKKNN